MMSFVRRDRLVSSITKPEFLANWLGREERIKELAHVRKFNLRPPASDGDLHPLRAADSSDDEIPEGSSFPEKPVQL